MKRMAHYMATLFLGLACSAALAATGCAMRYYDADHSDYHHWDRDEDRAYHDYWNDRHPREPYRDYSRVGADQQRDYWNWRHGHPDAGKDDNRNKGRGDDRTDKDRERR